VPWKEVSVLKEKVLFVSAYEEGQGSMTELCRHYGISRQTGHLWWKRYEKEGLEGLYELSRRPKRQPRKTSAEIRAVIVDTRQKYPRKGPEKIWDWLTRHQPGIRWPGPSTIGRILKEERLTKAPRWRRGSQAYPSALREAERCNDLWCIDFKGWFLTSDGHRCDPLTLMDQYSRYLLACESTRISGRSVQPILERCFREYGMPERMRSDNGPPFAGPSVGGLSRLAIWLVQLGVVPERIKPGRPQQNSKHERMHRTLKDETASPPAATLAAQQARFDEFRQLYNEDRGHKSLGMKRPADVYQRGIRHYTGKRVVLEYPSSMKVRRVQRRGEIYWQGEPIFLTELLCKEDVGLDQISDDHWKLYYGPLSLAIVDTKSKRVLKTRRSIRRWERNLRHR
jgi:putative transposase